MCAPEERYHLFTLQDFSHFLEPYLYLPAVIFFGHISTGFSYHDCLSQDFLPIILIRDKEGNGTKGRRCRVTGPLDVEYWSMWPRLFPIACSKVNVLHINLSAKQDTTSKKKEDSINMAEIDKDRRSCTRLDLFGTPSMFKHENLPLGLQPVERDFLSIGIRLCTSAASKLATLIDCKLSAGLLMPTFKEMRNVDMQTGQ